MQRYPMKVMRESSLKGAGSIKNIQEATDLFEKYSESHAVNRIHCDFETLTKKQQEEIFKIVQN
jgi:hypothetical protein